MTIIPAPERLAAGSESGTSRRPSVAQVLVPIDVAAALLAVGLLAGVERSGDLWDRLGFVVLWVAAVAVVGEYRRPGSAGARMRRLALLAFALPTVVMITAEIASYPLSARVVTAAAVISALAGGVGRSLLQVAASRGAPVPGLTRRVVVVGRTSAAAAVVLREQSPQLRVVGVCSPDPDAQVDRDAAAPGVAGLDACVAHAGEHRADALMVLAGDGVDPAQLRRLHWEAEAAGIDLVIAPGIDGVSSERVTPDVVAGQLILSVSDARLRGPVRAAMGFGQWLATLLGLLLVAPVLVVLAVLIRLDSPGPAIFRQTRIGRDGRPFTMWKLRTMTSDSEAQRAQLDAANEGAGPLFKMRSDPRITRVGRWLRRTSLDEVPQLVNVLRGEMVLVGPRPALPDEVASYPRDVRRRLAVRPGITGLWQVSGRSDLSWEDSVRLDQFYVDNWTPLLDLSILARTVVAVLGSRGAY